jgi:hypothetical protein
MKFALHKNSVFYFWADIFLFLRFFSSGNKNIQFVFCTCTRLHMYAPMCIRVHTCPHMRVSIYGRENRFLTALLPKERESGRTKNHRTKNGFYPVNRREIKKARQDNQAGL